MEKWLMVPLWWSTWDESPDIVPADVACVFVAFRQSSMEDAYTSLR